MVLIVGASVIAFIISVVASVAESVATSYNRAGWWDKAIYVIAVSTFWAAVAAVIAFFVAAIISIPFPSTIENEKIIEETELVATKDNFGARGDFVLGSGSVDGSLYYTYFYKGEDGAILNDKVPASRTRIIEEKRSDALLITKTVRPEASVRFEKFMVHFSHDVSNATYTLYVPEGSITTEVEMDLE